MPVINDREKNDVLEPLSERELEILRLIEEGCTNREIAQRLVLSLETVSYTHLTLPTICFKCRGGGGGGG